MNARRLSTALAISCACLLPTQAIGQPNRVYGPPQPTQAPAARAPDSQNQRLPVVEEPASSPSVSMIESWSLGDNAQLGLGRFRVMEIARPRSNMERVRSPLNMERETRPITGAGVSIRF